ncbi:MAG: hypothetical protein IKR83_02285 [Bacteroidales bacterium]|nr:hypothetical protein [Bacteroidales bacterium]
MRKIKLILAFISVLAMSCNADSGYGEIIFINETGDRYNVAVEGYQTYESFDMEGVAKRNQRFTNGFYNISIKQLDGYIFYPNRAEFSVHLEHNNPVTINLPDKIYY